MDVGVTPVPMGTLFCRFCKAMSIWLVAKRSGRKAANSNVCDDLENRIIVIIQDREM